jgi:hypothetical protein
LADEVLSRVYQAALGIHELVEIMPRTRQQLANTFRANIQCSCTCFARLAKNFTQDERQSLLTIEAHQHCGHTAQLRLLTSTVVSTGNDRVLGNSSGTPSSDAPISANVIPFSSSPTFEH